MKRQKTAYKGFKLNDKNELVCRDMIFRVGEIAEVSGQLVMCGNGIHFCWNLNDINDYYNLRDSVICEVEILGDVVNQEDMKKSCTNKLKVKRILTKEQVWKISNTGLDNTGYINSGDWNSGNCNSGNRNSGDWNSGNRNSGDWNSGNRNSGNRNSGNRNSGDWNSGDWNSGNRNSGDWNSGDWNSGNRNSGDCNSGDWNSGNRNSGDWNSGNCNSGNRNSGDWNSGNWNSGFFNTKENKCYIFDTLSDMTPYEFYDSKYYRALRSSDFVLTEWIEYADEEKRADKAKELIGGYLKKYDYKEACAKWWANMSKENREIVKSIPNFNADKFFEITGIRV